MPIIGIQMIKTCNAEISNNTADIYMENCNKSLLIGNKGAIKLSGSKNYIYGNVGRVTIHSASVNNTVYHQVGSVEIIYAANITVAESKLSGLSIKAPRFA